MIKKFLRKLIREKNKQVKYKKSYSQMGEDMIVSYLLDNNKNIFYMDIGCNHPFAINNTYHFYEKGFKGLCIEPNPILYNYFKKCRPKDICLNIGIGSTDMDYVDFYLMDLDVLNTFSKKQAEQNRDKNGHKILKTIKIPVKNINTILEKYCCSCPDFVSLDTEGFDIEILKTWDFNKYRPYVFCIETCEYNPENPKKIEEIPKIMLENGYEIIADTYINTIFRRTTKT